MSTEERKGTRVTFLDQTGAKSVTAVIADTVTAKRILPNVITKMNLPMTGPDGQPIGPEMMSPIFPMGLIEQEMSQDRWIDIPEEILEILEEGTEEVIEEDVAAHRHAACRDGIRGGRVLTTVGEEALEKGDAERRPDEAFGDAGLGSAEGMQVRVGF